LGNNKGEMETMSFFKDIFKSTDLNEQDLKVIASLKESLKGMDYKIKFNRINIVVMVKRE
jgi:hypothetical protein